MCPCVTYFSPQDYTPKSLALYMCAYNITEPPHREDWQIAIYLLDLYFLIAFPNSVLPIACAYTQPQMLPDVGMVNTYPECLDARECRPGLLSMKWYPSLFLKFFRQLIFPCRHTCSLETLGTIPTSRLVFVENVFTSLCYKSCVVLLNWPWVSYSCSYVCMCVCVFVCCVCTCVCSVV